MPLSSFHPVVQEWFQETYGQASPAQAHGWPAIARGENCLILAPTGSGKTLAAFLKCLDQLYWEGDRPRDGVQVLYISPLKALNNDVYRNLEVPLQGIEAKAAAKGLRLPHLTHAVRTGDTPQRDRAAMLKRPPDLLITTPESLYLMLTSQARRILRSVRYVIVDEIHALCGAKRGVHLSLSLERLEALLPAPPVRIGLSATQRPLDEIARYLGGVGREVRVVDAGMRKDLDLLVEVPLDDMRVLPENTMWAAIHPRLLELVQGHRSTIIFVNNRGLAERLADRLNGVAGREIARVHHGSMSRGSREAVEADLKAGRLPCLVATSSLELGIDIGAVDLVIQVESPKSVARGLQRVGRAGHVLGAASKGRLLPKFRADLLETACIVREMRRGEVEETRVPTGCLDVLAQQVTAMAAMDEWAVADLLALCRRSYCYRDLTERQLDSVLEMLSGRYPAEEFRELRPRVVWDREQGLIRGREGARMRAVLSGGTIPDRGYYGVYIQGASVKLGEVDEEFVYESRVGDVFLLGTSTWRIESIDHHRISVVEAFGAVPRPPFWKGEGIGRPYELGLKLGAFTREVAARLDHPDVETWLQAECCLDERAAANLVTYLRDQREAVGALASDRDVVAELFGDEVGDRRLVIHSPFGGRVNLAWSVVLKRLVRDMLGLEAEMTQSDDGIMIRLPGAESSLPVEQMLRLAPGDGAGMLIEEAAGTPVFGAYFRMNAERALVLPRPLPGKRRPFWLQRLRASDLLQVARMYDSFPVVLETFREVLRDVMDLEGLRAVLGGIASGDIGVRVVQTDLPSPAASSVMMGFISKYMYEEETPRAERRGALLGLNRDLLREILGAEGLRELLDPRAIAEVNARLQRTATDWRPRSIDQVEDALRLVGDRSGEELGGDPAWLAALEQQRRAARVLIAGEERWVAWEDRCVYEDVFTHAGAVIKRFARSRGPFTAAEAARRYGLTEETAGRYLAVLQAEGLVAAGEYTPGVAGREYCDVEVLQQIHRRTLSLLRQEVEPVDGAAYARFLLAWQGVAATGTGGEVCGAGSAGASGSGGQGVGDPGGGGRGTPGPAGRAAGMPTLRRALAQLQGLPLPAEAWERKILPARVPGYQPIWLDQLCATGELTYAAMPGGKLAFYLPDQTGLFRERLAPSVGPDQERFPEEETRVLGALRTAGADFLGGVARSAGLPPAAALESLWRLFWAGLVTNDTFAPVRQAMRGGRGSGSGSRGGAGLRSGTGRWSLTARLAPTSGPDTGDPGGPVPAEAYARLLLERYGVVGRELAQAEDGPVPWPAIADALKVMEMRGQARQGYFVRDLSGAQFALPEAVERLRGAREGGVREWRLISACDPAGPYGLTLPFPGGARISRLPSNYLVLEGGLPVLAAEGNGRRLVPLRELAGEELRQALTTLKALLDSPARLGARRRIEVEAWNDQPIHQSPVAEPLQGLGFERTPGRLVLYR